MKNFQIEGLRGIAIFIVIFFHVIFRFQQIYFGTFYSMSFLGKIGSTIFLLISSYFMIGKSNTNCRDYCTRFKQMIKRISHKILRLWPTYAICITITFILVSIFGLPGREVSLLSYLLNIFFINGFIGVPYVDSACWYITTLISLILVTCFIEYILNGSEVSYVLWLILNVILTLLGLNPIARFLGGNYIGIALIGISIKKIDSSKNNKSKFNWKILIFLGMLDTFVFLGFEHFLCLLVSLVFFILAKNLKLKFLNAKVFQFMGKISYPLYLCHQNISYILEYHFNYDSYSYLFGFFCIFFSICYGYVLWFLFEKNNKRIVRMITFRERRKISE